MAISLKKIVNAIKKIIAPPKPAPKKTAPKSAPIPVVKAPQTQQKLTVTKASSKTVAPAPTIKYLQPAAPAKVVQPAATTKYIQPTATAKQIQPAVKANVIQPATQATQGGVFTGQVFNTPTNPVLSAPTVTQPQPQPEPQSYFSMGDTGGGGGGGVATGDLGGESVPEAAPVYQPDFQVAPWNGMQYDLNDPTQRQNYYQSRIDYLSGERNKYITESETALNRSLSDAEKAADQNIATIDQDIADTEKEAGDYAREYFKNIQSLAEGKRMGDARRQQYYSGLSPNAYQSSLGTSSEYANEKYAEGLGEYAQGANEAVGSAYLQNPNDPNALGANTLYGRQRGTLMNEKSELGRKFNVFSEDIAKQKQKAVETAQNYFTQEGANLQNQLSPISYQQTGSPFSFARQNLQDIKTPTIDTSNQRKFTEFQTPQQYESTQPGTNFMPMRSSVFSQQEPIETYLGKTKVTPDEDKALRKYLFGIA